MIEIGVILPACRIPDGAIVTKRNGAYKHILKRKMVIYGKVKDVPREIEQQGIVFIIKSTDPDYITALPDDTILVWWTTEDEFFEYMTNKREEAGIF